jgi:hypothetical protein
MTEPLMAYHRPDLNGYTTLDPLPSSFTSSLILILILGKLQPWYSSFTLSPTTFTSPLPLSLQPHPHPYTLIPHTSPLNPHSVRIQQSAPTNTVRGSPVTPTILDQFQDAEHVTYMHEVLPMTGPLTTY